MSPESLEANVLATERLLLETSWKEKRAVECLWRCRLSPGGTLLRLNGVAFGIKFELFGVLILLKLLKNLLKLDIGRAKKRTETISVVRLSWTYASSVY